MRSILLFLLVCFPPGGAFARKQAAHPDTGFVPKQYYFVMLIKGPKRDQITDTNVINKLQEGHMDNMKRMAAAGKLIVAGPYMDDGNWRGLFIFDCPTKEEVERLLAMDPAIAAGRLAYEIHPWMTGKNCLFK